MSESPTIVATPEEAAGLDLEPLLIAKVVKFLPPALVDLTLQDLRRHFQIVVMGEIRLNIKAFGPETGKRPDEISYPTAYQRVMRN